MKTTNLTELLNDEQIKEVDKILNAKGYVWERTKKLKEYLGQFRIELVAKGVLPEYLSYVLIAKHMKVI